MFGESKKRERVALRRKLLSFSLCATMILLPASAMAQSGRRTPPSTRRASDSSRPPNAREQQQRPRTTATASPSPPQIQTPNFPPPPASTGSSENAAGASDTEEVVRINSNLVPLPVSVVDERGRAVTNLQLTDFELRVDGQPRTISDISHAETPVRIVMLFDNSSSLIQAREFEKQAAIRFFQRVMRPIDQAAIYSVSTVPVLEHDLTSNTAALVSAIERFGRPEGATALFDAVEQAARYLRPQRNRKVIVIVSDGADTVSDSTFDEALRAAQSTDCQIFAVRTGLSDNTNLRDLAAERRLEDFTAQTGGAVYVPRTTSDLDSAFTQIAADLAQQYVLSYYPTDERRDGRFRQINLRIVARAGLRIRTRRGYYAPQG